MVGREWQNARKICECSRWHCWYWDWTDSDHKKRSLCPIVFCNYNCAHIGIFPNSVVFYSIIYLEKTKFLHADGGLSLHATLGFSVGVVIWDKVTWLLANMTALYYKTANCSVISTDWSHLWYCAVVAMCYISVWYWSVSCSALSLDIQWIILCKEVERITEPYIGYSYEEFVHSFTEPYITIIILY